MNAGGGVQAGGWDAITGGGATAGAGPAASIGFPQPMQKRFPAGDCAPHCEQNIGERGGVGGADTGDGWKGGASYFGGG